jgi:hypothetical protein
MPQRQAIVGPYLVTVDERGGKPLAASWSPRGAPTAADATRGPGAVCVALRALYGLDCSPAMLSTGGGNGGRVDWAGRLPRAPKKRNAAKKRNPFKTPQDQADANRRFDATEKRYGRELRAAAAGDRAAEDRALKAWAALSDLYRWVDAPRKARHEAVPVGELGRAAEAGSAARRRGFEAEIADLDRKKREAWAGMGGFERELAIDRIRRNPREPRRFRDARATRFIVQSGKAIGGWEYPEDARDELRAMKEEGRLGDARIVARSRLAQYGIDPRRPFGAPLVGNPDVLRERARRDRAAAATIRKGAPLVPRRSQAVYDTAAALDIGARAAGKAAEGSREAWLHRKAAALHRKAAAAFQVFDKWGANYGWHTNEAIRHEQHAIDPKRPFGAPLVGNPPKGTPTETNVYAAADLIARWGFVPDRVDAVDRPHIVRLIRAGWLVRTPAGWLPPPGTPAAEVIGHEVGRLKARRARNPKMARKKARKKPRKKAKKRAKKRAARPEEARKATAFARKLVGNAGALVAAEIPRAEYAARSAALWEDVEAAGLERDVDALVGRELRRRNPALHTLSDAELHAYVDRVLPRARKRCGLIARAARKRATTTSRAAAARLRAAAKAKRERITLGARARRGRVTEAARAARLELRTATKGAIVGARTAARDAAAATAARCAWRVGKMRATAKGAIAERDVRRLTQAGQRASRRRYSAQDHRTYGEARAEVEANDPHLLPEFEAMKSKLKHWPGVATGRVRIFEAWKEYLERNREELEARAARRVERVRPQVQQYEHAVHHWRAEARKPAPGSAPF